MEVASKFFTENIQLGGSNLLEAETVNSQINIPITKWLYNYVDVGVYDAFE